MTWLIYYMNNGSRCCYCTKADNILDAISNAQDAEILSTSIFMVEQED